MNVHRAMLLALLPLLLAGDSLHAANLTVSPTSHDFGNQPFGQRKTVTIRVTNDGIVQRKIPVKSSSPHFGVNDTSLSIPGRDFVNLIVSLSDKTPPGAQSATITIDDGKDAIRVTVRAKVEAPPATPKPAPTLGTPTLSVSPTSLDFGTLELNQTKALTFTLTGSEAVTCQIRPNDSLFVATPSSVSLTPNQPASISVTFTAKFELQLRGSPKGTIPAKANVTCGASKASVDMKGTTPVPKRVKVLVPSFPLNAPSFRGQTQGDLLFASNGGTFLFCDPTDDRFQGPCESTPLAGAKVDIKATCGGNKKTKWTLATGSAAPCLGSTNAVCSFVINVDSTLNAICVP
jgi:hypothetical protein